MRILNSLIFCLVCFLVFACSSSDDDAVVTLASYVENRTTEPGGVIACAASDENTNEIFTFYYPEPGATNIRFYKTNTPDVDHTDYSNYTESTLKNDPFFNGYLGKFTLASTTEQWIIITFELNNVIKISNPIRSKQISKPTVWHDAVTIDQSSFGMPVFTWEANAFGDNAIYFQVIADADNNLLSGTYTFENQFQYYNTSNVVLNVTRETPPDLLLDNDYGFTLMDVSEDNWVNSVILKTFRVQ